MMRLNKIALYLILSIFVILAGCGTATENNGNKSDVVNAEELALKLEPSLKIEQNEQTVLFDVALKNNSNEDVHLTFPSGQQIEIQVTDENNEIVYTYSMNKSFIQAIQEPSLAAGEELTWQDEWVINEQISSNKFTANVEILMSHINEKEIGGQTIQTQKDFEIEKTNTAFRNVEVSGERGNYIVKGEARVFEGVFFYTVEDGHDYLVDETRVQVEGAPAWAPFELKISIPEDQLPSNATLSLTLFEHSAKDGTEINHYSVKLEQMD